MFGWKTSQELIVRKLPANRPALLNEKKKNLPTGPIVSNADGKVSQNRTYQDLKIYGWSQFWDFNQNRIGKMNLDGAETLINLLIFMQEFNFHQMEIMWWFLPSKPFSTSFRFLDSRWLLKFWFTKEILVKP